MPGGRTPLYQPGQSLYHIPGLITFDQDDEGDLESSYDTSLQQSQVQRTVLNDLNSSRENALQTSSCNLRRVHTAPKIEPHSNWFETGSGQCAFNAQ